MDEEKQTALTEAIRNALRTIIDPEIGGSLVDLGLIYDIAVGEGGIARITMTTTTRGCPASDTLKDAVGRCVRDVPGVEHAEVRLTFEPPWTPEMMAET